MKTLLIVSFLKNRVRERSRVCCNRLICNRAHILLAAMMFGVTVLPSHAVTVDFETLAPGVEVADQFAGFGMLFNQAATVESAGGTSICGAPSNSTIPTSLENVLLRSVDPVNLFVSGTTNSISVLFRDVELPTNSLETLDFNGGSLGIVKLPSSPLAQIISFFAPEIHSVVLHGFDDLAFDDINFNAVTQQLSAVSVPAARQFQADALGVLSLLSQRRKKITQTSLHEQ